MRYLVLLVCGPGDLRPYENTVVGDGIVSIDLAEVNDNGPPVIWPFTFPAPVTQGALEEEVMDLLHSLVYSAIGQCGGLQYDLFP